MNKLENLRDILEQHCGRRSAISSAKLAYLLGIQEDDTHSGTRELIFECAEKYQLPVAATNRGYYLLQTDEEYYDYIQTLEDRMAGIRRRAQVITENYHIYKERQQ